jgi:beta-lactamase class A
MTKALLITALVAVFPIILLAQENAALEEYLNGLPSEVKVTVLAQNGDGKVIFTTNEDKQIPSASIIKIPILIELFFQVESGHINLSEKHLLKEDEKVGGAGRLQRQPAGSEWSLEALAREMIGNSDNTATNILIDRVGIENVNQRMKALGFKHTQLNRKMMDFDAIQMGIQNYISPKEANDLLLMLHTGQILMPLSRNLVMEMLLNCEDKTTIPSQLPSNLLIAHKTGTLDSVRGDSGIIVGEDAIVMSVFVEDFSSTSEAEEIIGTVARLIWESAEQNQSMSRR